MSHVNIPLAG